MATSYSTNLALALPATGELSGTWGTTVNANITNMLDEALGYQAYSATGGADTLTIPDGTTGVARSIYIQLNGTGGGSVAVPTTKTKMYFVFNNTSSAITFKVTGQTGVSIPAAAKMALVSNGTDIIVAQNYFAALTLGAALPVASGGTSLTTLTANNVILGNGASAPTFVAPSTSGNLLTSNGTTWASTAPATSGTVTSVAMTVPSVLSISGSPITSTGTLALTYSGTALPVANGGTSLTTLTANNVILGNGASAPTFVAPSTSGNVLTSNGTTWQSTTPASGASGANPTATVSGTVVNGSASTFMRSDAAPALANTAVTAASYTNASITVDAQGRITSASSGSGASAATQTTLGTVYSLSTNSYGLTLGYSAGASFPAISESTAIGVSALSSYSSGVQNTVVGYSAGNGTAFSSCTAVGAYALSGFSSNSGNNNNAFGRMAMVYNTSGSENSAFGRLALYVQTTGGYNSVFGNASGQSLTTGGSNAFFGHTSALTTTTGSNNTIIGSFSDTSGVNTSLETVLGSSITGKGSSTAFIGGTSGAYNGANTTTWTTTSDARIKKNVVNLNNGLSVITALRPVEFDYKENDKHEVGFIAQEYQTVLPDQIIKHAANKAEKEMVGDDKVLAIQQNLVPYLVKALQELNAKFDAYVATHP